VKSVLQPADIFAGEAKWL